MIFDRIPPLNLTLPFSPVFETCQYAAYTDFRTAMAAVDNLRGRGQVVHASTADGILYYATPLHRVLTFPIVVLEGMWLLICTSWHGRFQHDGQWRRSRCRARAHT